MIAECIAFEWSFPSGMSTTICFKLLKRTQDFNGHTHVNILIWRKERDLFFCVVVQKGKHTHDHFKANGERMGKANTRFVKH